MEFLRYRRKDQLTSDERNMFCVYMCYVSNEIALVTPRTVTSQIDKQ